MIQITKYAWLKFWMWSKPKLCSFYTSIYHKYRLYNSLCYIAPWFTDDWIRPINRIVTALILTMVILPKRPRKIYKEIVVVQYPRNLFEFDII